MLKLFSRRNENDERGSLVIAIGVMTVLMLMAITVTTRSAATLRSVSNNQRDSSALAVSECGVAEAVFLIDQVQNASFTGTAECGEGEFEYEATRVSANEWHVQARGEVSGNDHAVEVKVKREVEYPYAIFTNQQLRMNGNSGGNIYSFNSITGATNTGNAYVASNHGIILNGGGGGDGQHYYTPNGSCSGCSNGTQMPGPRKIKVPSEPATFQACPTGGVFGTNVAGNVQIDGGGGIAYRCLQNISFVSGEIDIVNGPVIIYVGPNYSVTMSNTSINPGGHGKDFRLLKAGTGALNIGNGSHAPKVVGIIDAPNSTMRVNGGQMHVDGALILNELDAVNGGPNFQVRYDDSVSLIVTQDWKQYDWREIPPNSF